MNPETEYAEVALAIQRLADSAHELIPMFVSLEPDGSGSPAMLAKKAVFLAVPAPVDVLFIDITGVPQMMDCDSVWTLIRFDLSEPGVSGVRFVGEAKANDISSHREVLSEHFGIDDPIQAGLGDLSFRTCLRKQHYTVLAQYDIRVNPVKYGTELGRWLGLDTNLVRFFLNEPEFITRYGLQPDAVLPAPELLRLDFAPDASATDNRLRPASVEELQERISDIQLIPQVPDGVREIIRRAKMLYIYGYFEYSFFTIASHYTYAAVEAALRARWALCLPRPSKLKFKDKEVETERTSFQDIESHCFVHGWKTQRLFVNGRAFPWKSDMVVAWLRDEVVINDWQKRRFGEVYSKLRNLYSHMDGCSFHSGDSEALGDAVGQINILFDSVSLAKRSAKPAE